VIVGSRNLVVDRDRDYLLLLSLLPGVKVPLLVSV